MFDISTFDVKASNLSTRIAQTTYYLVELEKEVARAQGASNQKYRYKEDALGRIKALVEFAPDDERVQDLFRRAKACVKTGAGKINTVDPAMTIYLENEKNLRKHFAEVSEKAWKELLASHASEMLERVYPTPDFKKTILEDVAGKMVVLEDVAYPENQFMGTTGEYVWTGTRSQGMYFMRIDGREWLGPYEAVKRYRRLVDTTMNDVRKWSVLAKITDIAFDCPDANETKRAGYTMAWEVEPIALYVPGHVMAVYDETGEHTGRFIDEDKVAAMKEAWYTVREVPDDVTPERLMEIFMYAIKEKNFDLFMDCITPDRRETAVQQSLINYHWDLHQERFHGEYIHANVNPDKTVIRVIKGYDDTGVDAFFLDEDELAEIKKAYGEKEEEASVQTVALDANGKQLGSPSNHRLKRVGDGRWYVNTYEIRF